MTTEPKIEIERISIVTPIQGRDGSVMAERVMTFGGETRPINPIDLYKGNFDGATLPQEVQHALAAIDAQQQTTIATLTAERDTLQTQISTLTTERDNALAQLAAANERIATLQSRIDEMTAQPAEPPQPIATLSQIRVWLLKTLGVTAIEQVNSMIASIPDELQRAIAYQQWEYANQVLRDNPFVLMIAQRLGLSEEQMDAAYLEATRIV